MTGEMALWRLGQRLGRGCDSRPAPRSVSGQRQPFSAERTQTLANVKGVRISRRDAAEQLPRPRHIPRPFVQVSQRVRLAQMTLLRMLHPPVGPLQQCDGAGEVTLVRPAASGHDSALGHQVAAGEAARSSSHISSASSYLLRAR